jgi:hypothetical protein
MVQTLPSSATGARPFARCLFSNRRTASRHASRGATLLLAHAFSLRSDIYGSTFVEIIGTVNPDRCACPHGRRLSSCLRMTAL